MADCNEIDYQLKYIAQKTIVKHIFSIFLNKNEK